jgi:hypothetical protein
MKRPQVTRITVEVKNSKGNIEKHEINPDENVAMFWGDLKIPNLLEESSVTGILGTFYDNARIPIKYPVEIFEKAFGREITGRLSDKRQEKDLFLNKELIRKIWEEARDKDGELKPFLLKKPECFIG